MGSVEAISAVKNAKTWYGKMVDGMGTHGLYIVYI